jgi:hypothetical protein
MQSGLRASGPFLPTLRVPSRADETVSHDEVAAKRFIHPWREDLEREPNYLDLRSVAAPKGGRDTHGACISCAHPLLQHSETQ